MPSAEKLDAVTIDGMGTLVELPDPSENLRAALAGHGVNRTREETAAAFAAEGAHYIPRSHEGRDEESLARLRRECVAVFLAELEADLEPSEFVAAYMESLEFTVAPGAEQALRALRGAGLALVCVANWDIGLHEYLPRLRVASLLDAVVTSADVGVAKPDPAIFAAALERVGVTPERALHIGDGDADREGALAAGLAFEPAPLATLPRRLGL